jgi:hypothetical protein
MGGVSVQGVDVVHIGTGVGEMGMKSVGLGDDGTNKGVDRAGRICGVRKNSGAVLVQVWDCVGGVGMQGLVKGGMGVMGIGLGLGGAACARVV